MKIIHAADIHLDSPLSGVKNSAMRRHELLTALVNLAEYANKVGAAAIIIAGDLFDDKFTTAQTIQSVADIITGSSAQWFVLKGNHGGSAPYAKLFELCPQICTFGDDWTSYALGNVTICGRELGRNDSEQWGKLQLSTMRYNLLVLHGDVDDDSYGQIDKRAIAQSGAKYVALGHRHAHALFKFGEVKVCYSGVLEARGFDETENTGFVEIDTDTDSVRFVPQAIRSVITKKIDVTNITSNVALQQVLAAATAEVSSKNYLNLVFCGVLREGLHLDMVARELLGDRFFALRIKDETTTDHDVTALMKEVSLRGEFVRLAQNIADDKLRDEVLKLGLSVLSGDICV